MIANSRFDNDPTIRVLDEIELNTVSGGDFTRNVGNVLSQGSPPPPNGPTIETVGVVLSVLGLIL